MYLWCLCHRLKKRLCMQLSTVFNCTILAPLMRQHVPFNNVRKRKHDTIRKQRSKRHACVCTASRNKVKKRKGHTKATHRCVKTFLKASCFLVQEKLTRERAPTCGILALSLAIARIITRSYCGFLKRNLVAVIIHKNTTTDHCYTCAQCSSFRSRLCIE